MHAQGEGVEDPKTPLQSLRRPAAELFPKPVDSRTKHPHGNPPKPDQTSKNYRNTRERELGMQGDPQQQKGTPSLKSVKPGKEGGYENSGRRTIQGPKNGGRHDPGEANERSRPKP